MAEEFNNDEPEEIIITGDGKESSSTGGKGKEEGSGGDSDSEGGGAKVDKDSPEEGEKKESEGGDENEGGKGEDGEPKPKDEEDEDGEEEDDETIETVDCAVITGTEKGIIGKVNKKDIRAENREVEVSYDYTSDPDGEEWNITTRPLREIVLINDYVAYKVTKDADATYIGRVTSVFDSHDVEKNSLGISEFNFTTKEYVDRRIPVSYILHKMPNCAIISGKYIGRVGCFYEGDIDDLLQLQQIELFENSGGDWKASARFSTIALFERSEYVTFNDKVKINYEGVDAEYIVEPRYISWGTPKDSTGVGDNFLWVTKVGDKVSMWQDVREVMELNQSAEGQGIFESLTIQIIDDIISQFKEKGTFPNDRDNFLYCHLPKAIRKSVVLLERANGMDNQRLDIEIKTTLETMIEFDREVAKTLLRHIQSSGYNFDPIYGFGSIFYDCLKELGVFNMVNTALVQDNMNVVSIYRDKNRLFFYSTIGYIFMEEIIFGDRKNITKFALWQNERAERIDALYSLLNFLVGTSRDKESYKDVVKYPEINEEVGRIFLLQLKALQDAI